MTVRVLIFKLCLNLIADTTDLIIHKIQLQGVIPYTHQLDIRSGFF